MKKLLNAVRNLFKPRKSWNEQMAEDLGHLYTRLLEMQREHALEAEFDAAWLAAAEEERILTSGRPVTLLPPSRTLH